MSDENPFRLLDFEWQKDRVGYELVQLDEVFYLQSKSPISTPPVSYRPLDTGSEIYLAHEIVAKADPNDLQAVLSLANRYGLISSDPDPSTEPNLSDETSTSDIREQVFWREEIALWQVTIERLRVETEMVRTKRVWELVDAWSPRSGGGIGGANVKVSLVDDSTSDSPRLVIRPSDLDEALQLQFALTVSAGLEPRWCPVCMEPFPIGPNTGRRSDAVYCSKTCQQAAAYRRRAKEAK